MVLTEYPRLKVQNSDGEIFAVSVGITKQSVTVEFLLEDLRRMIKERSLQDVLVTKDGPPDSSQEE